jgi:hypothetical protein
MVRHLCFYPLCIFLILLERGGGVYVLARPNYEARSTPHICFPSSFSRATSCRRKDLTFIEIVYTITEVDFCVPFLRKGSTWQGIPQPVRYSQNCLSLSLLYRYRYKRRFACHTHGARGASGRNLSLRWRF